MSQGRGWSELRITRSPSRLTPVFPWNRANGLDLGTETHSAIGEMLSCSRPSRACATIEARIPWSTEKGGGAVAVS